MGGGGGESETVFVCVFVLFFLHFLIFLILLYLFNTIWILNMCQICLFVYFKNCVVLFVLIIVIASFVQ